MVISLAVTAPERTTRYGSEYGKNLVTIAQGSSSPFASVRPSTTATCSTHGAFICDNWRKITYSRLANSDTVSLTA